MKAPLTLSPEFQYVLDLLEKSKNSVFITGRAGTGKSTLLQLFRNTTRKKIAVLAPTGVAALNVGGQTIHSFFGFPPRIITPKEAGRKVMIKQQKRLFNSLELLIIDEISMVRADMLDGIDRFLRVNRENPMPFGGVQVAFFGDLFQLPPVVTKDPIEQSIFQDYYRTPYFFSAQVMRDESLAMEMVELRKVFRQESRHFLRLLEAIRINTLDRDDLEDLNDRCIPSFSDTEGYITLTARNATADRINRIALENLPTKEFSFDAEVKGAFENTVFPTEANLRLRKGAQVMFVKNDNNERQYVNGSIGTVVSLDAENIGVELIDAATGRKNVVDVPKENWEIIRYKGAENGDIETETVGSFKQFPLKLAWAITIHKSQGKTFDRVVIDLGGGAFEHGQLYVALSRCRTLEGIVLRTPIRPQDVITDERVVDFYAQAFEL